MRARVYSNGGNSTGGFTFNGGQLTGALILAGNPSEPLEAASKQYVDSSLVNLNASNLATGTLPSARLPSFAGDIVKPAGSSTINLAPIGITAGDYVKPTVDAKGRVTGGSVLTADDITNLSWDKITTGKPTTLAGYGINDGISLSGGTLTGFLTFNGSITGSMQAVTKQYVDLTLSSSSGIAIGDVIRKPYATTPSGFLKCNGAEISKTTYSSLYAVIGDRFSKQKHFTSGRPWQQQYNINETQNSDISGWVTGTALPASLSTAQAIVTKNRVYILGGYVAGVGASSAVYTATVQADGSLNAWSTGTALPGVLCYSQVTIIKNRIYLFGGSTDGNNSVTTVYTTTINSDGTLGAWTTGTALPAAISNVHLIITNSRVYLAGGNSGNTYVSTVYYAVINSDGTLGAWTAGTALPEGFYCASTVLTKNRVYLCGGRNVSEVFSKVYTAAINTDGTIGTWSLTSNPLPMAVWTATPYVTKNRVYLIGGTNSATTPISTVLTAPINSDGTIGTWSVGTSMPSALAQSYVLALKNKLYTFGGYGISTVYVANISGGMNDYSIYYTEDTTNYTTPGSGKPWQQQYQINEAQAADITGWALTNSLPGVLYGSQAVVTKNRVYLLGGVGASGTDGTTTVYTAPINSDGTLGTWVSGTPLPYNMSFSQALVTKNRVYLFGGIQNGEGIDTVYTAPINSDGTLGTWSNGSALFNHRGHSQILAIKNKVYLFGGENRAGSSTNSIHEAPINSDGTIGTWDNPGTNLPVTVKAHQIVLTHNKIYLLGGNGSNSIYVANILDNGSISSWSSAGTLPSVTAYSQTFITKNTIYIISGTNGSSNITTTYYANIDSKGNIGSWITGGTLPFSGYYHTVFATKNRIYSAGGILQPGVRSAQVYMASILGGENDYSPYYDGTITAIIPVDSSTTFALPDLTQSEKFDTVSYIKY